MTKKVAKKVTRKAKQPVVSIIMGSDSDFFIMKEAAAFLKKIGIPYEISIISAHRTPQKMAYFAENAQKRGIQVIIAGAGGAAHLPGMVAAHTALPVIGVPVPLGFLQGQDALLSIVQMPKGVPVATVAIGNGWNAGILAAQIIGAGSAIRGKSDILDRITQYKQEMREQVLAKKIME